ncbi:MAG: hypothetical protein M1821_006313 [Bathelium mastoideum]|nr:MAG: hypothetical protein M1821_006313 [Bathelium mastoideum]KAI9693591.1 MAG: hypothetical protein M1822_002862 [Bathelium mastoideum]
MFNVMRLVDIRPWNQRDERRKHWSTQRFEHEVDCSRRLVEKLLELGLDPNTKATSFFRQADLIWSILPDDEGTHWQLYLKYLDWFFSSILRAVNPVSIRQQVLSLVKPFLEHGADCTVLVEFLKSHKVEYKTGNGSGSLDDGVMTLQKSALHIIDECCTKAGYPPKVLTETLQANSATEIAMVTKVTSRVHGGALTIFTVDQHRKLLCSLRSYQENFEKDQSNRRRFDEAVQEVLEANQEYIVAESTNPQ